MRVRLPRQPRQRRNQQDRYVFLQHRLCSSCVLFSRRRKLGSVTLWRDRHALRPYVAVQNPFGSAKPRETVLAAKLGKKEEDILKEELIKDKINVRI